MLSYSKLILTEVSKQAIINLNYPEVLASVFIERFGKNAFILAKWFKETIDVKGTVHNNDWLNPRNAIFNKDLFVAIKLYEAASVSMEVLEKTLDRYDLLLSDPTLNLSELKLQYKKTISEELLKHYFFSQNIVKAILNGEIENLAPYKDLSIKEADLKYEKKLVFKQKEPIMTFPDGYKWINVGEKCNLVGQEMKNCGSTGVMSFDKERTMVVLFDKRNGAHIVLTYSPQEQRVSGIEGQAGTDPKEKYYPYIIALIEKLGAGLDNTSTSTPTSLKIIYTFGDNLIETQIIDRNTLTTTKILKMKDGKRFLTRDGYTFFDVDAMETKGIDYKNTNSFDLSILLKAPEKLGWFDMVKLYGQRKLTNRLYESVYSS